MACTVPIFSAFELSLFFPSNFLLFVLFPSTVTDFAPPIREPPSMDLYSIFSTQAEVRNRHLLLMCHLKDPKVMLDGMWNQIQGQGYPQAPKVSFETKNIRNVEMYLVEPLRNPSFALEMKRKRKNLVWFEEKTLLRCKRSTFFELNVNNSCCKPKGPCLWNRSLKHHRRTDGAFEPGMNLPGIWPSLLSKPHIIPEATSIVLSDHELKTTSARWLDLDNPESSRFI